MSDVESILGTPIQPLGGGTFRSGNGSWTYMDGKRVRVPDQVPYVPERPAAPAQPVRHAGGSNRKAVEREDGRVYESVNSAAANNLVSRASIRTAICRGSRCNGYRWRYVGQEWKPEPERSPVPNVVAVRCRETGEEWSSMTACAMDLGVTRPTIANRIRDGVPIKGRTFERVVEP